MDETPVSLLIAALGGLAIGVERQRSGHATGPRAHFAGVRTFTLIGACGGLSGWLLCAGFPGAAVVLLSAVAALVVVAYAAASRVDIDGTTEVSAVVVLGAGLLSGLGQHALGSGIIAVLALVLVEKSRLHSLVARIDDEPLRAAARFAVMAVVILPLLPEGPYGPWNGVRPRQLWMLVLFFSGLSFAGYLARRAVGARFGFPLAGLLGGLVSSTNVTLSFARLSRTTPAASQALAYGVIAASTMLFARVAVAVAVLNTTLLRALWPYLVAPAVVGIAALLLGLRHVHRESESPDPPANPLQLFEAIQMAVLFQVVLFATEAAHRFGGNMGVVASGAVLGLTDLDALTISMARGAAAAVPVAVASRAIVAGLIANTVLKTGLAVAVGRPDFRRRVAIALAAMIVVLVLSLTI